MPAKLTKTLTLLVNLLILSMNRLIVSKLLKSAGIAMAFLIKDLVFSSSVLFLPVKIKRYPAPPQSHADCPAQPAAGAGNYGYLFHN